MVTYDKSCCLATSAFILPSPLLPLCRLFLLFCCCGGGVVVVDNVKSLTLSFSSSSSSAANSRRVGIFSKTSFAL
jgi:hypothetical protein